MQKFIEFIVACPPGRQPIDLPTKQESTEVLKDPQFSLKSSVSSHSFKEKFDSMKGAINMFEGNPIIKKNMVKRKDSLAVSDKFIFKDIVTAILYQYW